MECKCYIDNDYQLHKCREEKHPDNHNPLCLCGDRLNVNIACGCHYFCEKCVRFISNIGCIVQEKKMIDITVVLDKSGSMNIIKDSTIKGYNSFVEAQKEMKTEGSLTLVQFGGTDYQKSSTKPIPESPQLNTETYKPDGWTPLFDALGKTIVETGEKLRDMKDKPDKVVFVVITDGQENYSKDYKREDIFKMIDHQKTKYNWEFIYLGANQDSFLEAGHIGINQNSTMNFSSSACMYKNVSTLINRYSVTGDISFTAEERHLQEVADKSYRS